MSRFIQQSEKEQSFKEVKPTKPTKPAPGKYTSEQLQSGKKIYSGTGGKY